MNAGIQNYSEIGKLNKVLLHRLGEEIEGLVPGNFERLLFDDIPYLKVAQEEHDFFADLLRENDVEVVYYVGETAKALENPNAKKDFVKELIADSNIYSQPAREALEEHLLSMEPEVLVGTVIAGIKKSNVEIKYKDSLAGYIASGYPYYTDPMPNLYFTRDPGACVGNGVSVHHMSTVARRRESLLLKYIYLYNKDFAPQGTNLWYDYDQDYSIEGGDILVLNKDLVAVGLSQRTTANGIETFAKNILEHSAFQKILVFDIPKTRAFMHLDTVFTMVDYDKFTIHPEIRGPLQVYEMTLDTAGRPHFESMQGKLEKILSLELGVPSVELILCGGTDAMAAQREQWNDGSNTLAIAPGKVITYERNYVTNDLLDKKGIQVITMPSSELSRGRGGPRCMSCPIHRDEI